MSSQVSCPNCKHVMFGVTPGTEIFCESCGQRVSVPFDAAAMSPPPMAQQSSSGSNVLLIVLPILAVVMLMCGGILVALLLPAVQAAREAARRMSSSNNLKQIGLALHNYHDTYRVLPASTINNDDGTPRTSWRTSILPFVEASPLYDKYDFNVSWDSPANSWTSATSIPTYHSPSSQEPTTTTSYFMLTGPNTIGDNSQGFLSFRDVTDGLSNTIMVVEVEGLNVPWAEPTDITLAELQSLIASGQVSSSPGGFNVLMADGAVMFLSLSIDPNVLELLTLRNDGEAINPF